MFISTTYAILCPNVKVRTALGQPPGPKGKTLRLMVSPAPVPAAVNNDVDDNNDDQNNNARARDLNRLVVRCYLVLFYRFILFLCFCFLLLHVVKFLRSHALFFMPTEVCIHL